MRVGVVVPMSAGDHPPMPRWADIHEFARRAEELSFDSLWVCDHFISDPGDRSAEGIHEAWTILSSLAVTTTSIELGQLVMCGAFRNPGLLAKMATTADEVSGGRIILGVGAGWYDAEFEAFGYPVDHRVSRLEEAVRIIVGLLRGDTVSLAGRFHRANGARLIPAPSRRVPLLLAGNGERMLQLTAAHADAWNTAWFATPDKRLRARLEALNAALLAKGRDPTSMRRTVGVWIEDSESVAAERRDSEAFSGNDTELLGLLADYRDLGVDDLIVGLTPMNATSLQRLAAVVAAFRGHS
jgi:alkanesulfonate monooxygenase SsuD/methylene tetrahydromethanopterin reductase-like flavin-dependent oxidoreductase (luciferase family)